MSKNKWLMIISILLVAAFVLVACATPTPETIIKEVEKIVTQEVEVVKEVEKIVTQEVEVVVTQEVEVIKEVEVVVTEIVEVEVEAKVDRTGAWLDRVVVVEEPSGEAAIARLQAGEIDLYAYGMSNADLFDTVRNDPNLAYSEVYGSFNEVTLNPAGNPLFEGSGTLNPFSNLKIREAMNWALDREYIAEEIMGGLAVPRAGMFSSISSEKARYPAASVQVETYYQYDLEKARAVITAEMEAMGAEMVDGTWHFEGEQIVLVVIQRVEDERFEIGNYTGNQLAALGFAVDLQPKTMADAGPIWQVAPEDGLWHVYTGGWGGGSIPRDSSWVFAGYGTDIWLPWDIAQIRVVDPVFYDIAEKLWNGEFTTMEERQDMMEYAIVNGPKEAAYHIMLVDRISYIPRNAAISVATDLAAGVSGTRLWAPTIRYNDKVGGEIVFAMPSILTEPWNAIAGSNTLYDAAMQRATGQAALIPDPYTGLLLPNRVAKAELVVEEGLPVGVTLDYVTLSFEPEILVPEDAWYDWNAETSTFITVGEAFTETPTALTKSVVYYEDDLFDINSWHDGSPVTIADFIMGMIMTWEQGKEASTIYDEGQVANLQAFMSIFKGVRIVSEDPLVIETYSDGIGLDAENLLTSWWPYYAQGEAAWHALVPGIMAEAEGSLAFSSSKASANEVEWMSYIAGPSLEILNAKLGEAIESGYIPFAATLGQYVTAEEAAARYANLQNFFNQNGHFWVNSGVFVLDKVFPTARTVTLQRFVNFPDSAEKWSGFGDAPIAEVILDGPGRVTAGDEAIFEVVVNLFGTPISADVVLEVRYLVFDATGAVAFEGVGEYLQDGLYTLTVSGDDTGTLVAGASKIQAIVSTTRLAIPSFVDVEFVVVAP